MHPTDLVDQPAVRDGVFTAAALHRPAGGAVTELVRHRLEVLEAARVRLADRHDLDALHDFRVSLRRLRSLLRGPRRLLADAVPDRLAAGLRRLARATNPSRDLEVKLGWLEALPGPGRRPERAGRRWLVRQLEAARREADTRAADRIAARFESVARGLEQGLDALPADHGPPLSVEVVRRLESALGRFVDRLDRVGSIRDQRAAHAARIAGKRVRYLLEPIAAAVPDAADAVAAYRGFQDAVGEMHDAHVLGRAIARARKKAPAKAAPGLDALAALARERRGVAWSAVAGEWLAARDERLFAPVRRVVAALVPDGQREIERKFLLSALPARARRARPVLIEQGYLPGDRIQERIRRVTAPTGRVRWFRTLKSGHGLVRREVEEETTRRVFTAMWPLTRGARVRKRRYRVRHQGVAWELDDFADRSLVLAEVELSSPDQAVELPPWLEAVLVREVTGDPAYANVTLAG